MRKISNIQVLRGLAALAVVVFHARDEADGLARPSSLPSFLGGAFGVDVFFVISGVVMVTASAPLFGAARSALPFVGKRLARVAPLYWAVTALFVLLDPTDARGDLAFRAFAKFVVLSLAFVPYAAPFNDESSPVYSLGWTLNYELAFYLCFALALALPRRHAVAALALGFAGLVTLNKLVHLPNWLSYLASSQIVEFAAGLLIAEAVLSGWRLPCLAALAPTAVALAAVLLAARFSDHWWGAWRGVVWGLPAAVVVGTAALCRSADPPGPARRAFERLGDASYALYLVHHGLFIAVEAALARAVDLSRVPAVPFMALLVVLAVGAAFAVHHAFEAPVTRWLQRRVAPHQSPSLAVSKG